MSNLLTYWNLRERPFELVTDGRFFFLSAEHTEALARLRYLVNERTMYAGLLSGEIGCGKSITGRVFAGGLDPRDYAVVVFENAHFRFPDHMRHLAARLGVDTKRIAAARTSAQVYELVREILTGLGDGHGRHLVLVFDEAQDLRSDTLADLKRLLNFNDDGRGRLTLILLGQPELRARIRTHAPLDQRISLRFHLEGMTAADCRAYLEHRLRVAGHPTGDLFAEAAHQAIAAATRGVPRELNRIAKLALESARNVRRDHVAAADVAAVVEDLATHRREAHLTPIR
ncbi:MAG: AAA family ATPase [Opitutaceae bacterium]